MDAARLQSRLAAVLAADIAGYARLTGEDPEATVRELKARQALVLPAVAAHGGRIVDTAGDGLLAEFPSAVAAVECALRIQALMAQRNGPLPEARRMRFRIGINLGEVIHDESRIYGEGLHIAARLEQLAEPGGLCVSASVHDAVDGRLALRFADLGTPSLKHIARPVRVYALATDDDRTAGSGGPPISTRPAPGAAPMQSIPAPPRTALIGRDAELEALEELAATHRLITIAGPGGSGKTRLAKALMARSAGQAGSDAPSAWVDLSVVTEAADIGVALAAALNVTLVPEVDPLGTVEAAVRDRHLRLVVDNAEHLVEAVAAVVHRLLDAAPALTLIVTSQQPLHVAGEHVLRLGGLAVAAADAELDVARASPAVALLCERAAATDARFRLDATNVGAIVAVCRRLDGLPLALELAAARLPLLGPEALLRHLDARLELLTVGNRGAPSRQQTLRATLEWSHGLLGAAEQAVFRRLAVCAGGCTLEVARQVAVEGPPAPATDGADWAFVDRLGALVDRSLVNANGSPEPRYSLAESARAYAWERLREAGELDATRDRHVAAQRALLEHAFEDFWALDDRAFMARYAPDLDNLRTALARSRTHDPEAHVSMVGAAVPLFRHLSLIREGVAALRQAATLVRSDMPAAVRARFHYANAMLGGGGATAAQAAIDASREAGDARGEYLAMYWLSTDGQASIETLRRLVDGSRRIESPAWPPKVHAIGMAIAEQLAFREGRHDAAAAALDRRIALCEAAGAEDMGTSCRMYRVLALFGAGDVPGAVDEGHAVIDRCLRLGNNYRLSCMQATTFSAMLLLEPPDLAAVRALATAFVTLEGTLAWTHVRDCADGFALIAALEGRLEDAARLAGFAAQVHREDPRDPVSEAARGRVEALFDAAGTDTARLIAARAEGASLVPEAAARLALGA
jgi:predicted ATPase/class 3 adenylate cyclase